MSNLSLKELAKEIKKQQAIADMDPGTEIATRRMRLGNINQAKEKLEGLNLEYRKAIMANAIFILSAGKSAQTFTEIAEKSGGCFAVDAEDFYMDLIKDVPEQLYVEKTVSGNLLEFISNNLEEKARSLNIVSYPGLVMESKYKKVLKTKEDLLALTKTLINEKVGAEMVGIDAVDRIVKRVLKSKGSGKKVPIVVQVSDDAIVETLARGLKRSITRKTFVITSGEENDQKLLDISFETVNDVTEENVEKTLMKLNKSTN